MVVFGSRGGEGNLLAVGVGACAADATLLGIASCRNGIDILHQTDGLPEVAIVAAPTGFTRVEAQVVGAARAAGRSRPVVAAALHIVDTRPFAVTRSRQEDGTCCLQLLPLRKGEGLVIRVCLFAILACKTRPESDTLRASPTIGQEDKPIGISSSLRIKVDTSYTHQTCCIGATAAQVCPLIVGQRAPQTAIADMLPPIGEVAGIVATACGGADAPFGCRGATTPAKEVYRVCQHATIDIGCAKHIILMSSKYPSSICAIDSASQVAFREPHLLVCRHGEETAEETLGRLLRREGGTHACYTQ